MKEGGDSRIELRRRIGKLYIFTARGRSSTSLTSGVFQPSKRQKLANMPRSKLTRHQTFTIPYVEDAPHMYSEISDKFTSTLANILINPYGSHRNAPWISSPFPP